MAGMDSISGYGGMGGLRGYGGLASGLDRDTLIKDMTYGTTSKIEKQKQKKMLLQWKQEAIRNISTKMIDFANKYTATMTSSTNLFSSAFWGKASASPIGEFSKLVSVSGTLKGAKDLSILGVKQLAKNARWTSQVPTETSFETGELKDTIEQEKLEGTTINVEYNGTNYRVKLPSGDDYDYTSADKIAEAINKAFENVEIKGDQKLSDVMKVTADADGKISFAQEQKDFGAGNTLILKGGTALEHLGMEDEEHKFRGEDGSNKVLTGEVINNDDLITKVDFVDAVAGKQMTFKYNGKTAAVKIPEKDDLTKGILEDDTDEEKHQKVLENMKNSIQDQLNSEFGNGRIKVTLDENTNKLSFETVTQDGSPDKTSVLSVVGGDSALVGDQGALGIKAGTSNRVNMNAKLSDLGITADKFVVNGKEVTVDAEKDTVKSLMEKINNETNIEISYQEASGKFMITAKQEGAGGRIDIDKATMDAFAGIFGFASDKSVDGKLMGVEAGQDAVIRVKYGDGEAFDIERGSNTFDLDGLNISVKGEFGYDKTKDDWDPNSEAVTFDVKTDTETIINGIKDMVKDYNEIIELINKESSTRPNRDYVPLTSEQKKELSEDEIKLYEEKAKEGLLFGDSDMRSLSSALRFVINPSDLQELEKMGISVSSSYSDNGKLSIDENKLKAALEDDPDKVKEFFTKTKTTDENGDVISSDGIATNLKNVLDRYVNTMGATKGILIERAGSIKAPASITKNAIYKQMQEIDGKITDLQRKLKVEQDRYIKQFTSLETLISQMNSQSSWLSQFGGGY